MTIIHEDKLNECGYITNKAKNLILPINQKDHAYYRLEEQFLVVFNEYDLIDRDYIIKQKLDAEIKRLARSGAIVY